MSGAAKHDGITRRDFLDGVALALAGGALGSAAATASAAAPAGPAGQDDQAMAVAHALRDDPRRFERMAVELDPGEQDLVVVGAGLSGLAAAWWYRRHAGADARVLLIDPQDEPGGHARRNEFVSRSGRRIVGYGGSQALDTPGLFSPAVHELLRETGVDLDRFPREFFDAGWTARHGLQGSGLFFDERAWGTRRMVVRRRGEAAEAWLARTPLVEPARADWRRLLEGRPARPLPVRGAAAWRARLASTSYRDFLLRDWGLHPQVAQAMQATTQAYFGVGIEATSALDAWAAGLPGFGTLALGDAVDSRHSPSARMLMAGKDDYVYHFPDGNAGVARALLRALRPDLVPGQGMESLVDARIDSGRLDDPHARVRLRQRSTVVAVRHLGPPGTAALVEVRYVDASGRLRAVRGRHVVLACWHRVVARIAGELPEAQRRALDDQVKVPLLYATVLVSNWRAWQRAGIASVRSVGGFWSQASLDFPVSMGSQRFPSSPDEPMLLHLSKVVVPGDGSDPRTQAARGRRQLASWRFEELEDEIRRLLDGALGGHGFDPAREIEAITVNRWAHGYSYEYMRPWDRYWPDGALPCEAARRGWGRIAIAGSDSGAYAYAHSAIDQAARAVQELLPSARLPAGSRVPGPDPQAIGLA